MLKACLDCGQLFSPPRGSRCLACQARRAERYQGTLIKPGHVSGWAWGRLRDALLQAQPWCAICAAVGRQTPATRVDHKIRRVDGGTDALENLQPICKACHDAKHGRGQGAGGFA